MIEARPAVVGETVGQMLEWARRRLQSSPSARLDAEILLAGALGHDRAWLLTHEGATMAPPQARRYRRAVIRRAAGEPIAYVRGHIAWWDLDLEVTRDVLIPRPETELLLESAIELTRKQGARVLADIGTGSGAIAIALARALPNTTVYAVDVDEAALAVAARNRASYGLDDRIVLVRGSLLSAIEAMPDVIVANLPYLSEEMMARIDSSVAHEPRGALFGGPRGSDLYAALFMQLAEFGWQSSTLVEIDPRQAGDIRRLAAVSLPHAEVSLRKDYAGHERIVTVQPGRECGGAS